MRFTDLCLKVRLHFKVAGRRSQVSGIPVDTTPYREVGRNKKEHSVIALPVLQYKYASVDDLSNSSVKCGAECRVQSADKASNIQQDVHKYLVRAEVSGFTMAAYQKL